MITEANRIERVVILTKTFIRKRELTTLEAAQMTGVSRRTIQRDFAEMSRALNIRFDNGRWLYEETTISPY